MRAALLLQVAEDTEALRASCRALAALYVRGLLAGTVLCVLLSELAVRTRLVRAPTRPSTEFIPYEMVSGIDMSLASRV